MYQASAQTETQGESTTATITLTFDQAVNASGAGLTLSNGDIATLDSGNNTDSLTFVYSNSASRINGVTIADTSGLLVQNAAEPPSQDSLASPVELAVLHGVAISATPVSIADSAVSGSGFLNKASDTAGQALTGTAEPNSTVTIYLNTSTATSYTTTADASGAWSQTIGSLADGTYRYSATATDAAANTASNSLGTFTVDTQAPAAPTGLADSSISNAYVNATRDTTGQALTGSAEAGSTVSIYLNGSTTPALTTTANASGVWSRTVGSLTNGTYSYSATATDAAGNTGPAASLATFTVDVTAPTAPTISDSAVSGGYVNAAQDVFRQALTGTAEAGSTVAVYLNRSTTPYATTTASSRDGTWGVALDQLPEGTYSYTATATDAAGNTGPASAALAFTVDTQAPAAPTFLADSSISNNYVNAAHDTTGQALTGSAEANSTVSIYLNGSTTPAFTTTANATGAWSQTIGSLPEGTYSYTATATDAAGNAGPASAALAFTVDTQAPAAPTFLADSSISNNYVNAAHDTTGQALTGSAEANSTVSIYLNGSTTPALTTTANATGAWSQTIGSLADGTYSYTATATDAAGNAGPASAALAFTVDTQAPAAPTFLADSSISNNYVNAAHDTTGQALTGSAEANSTVSIYLNGSTTPALTTTANATGAWSKTIGSLADGTYSYSATATDAAGNTSLPASLATFTVDAHAPSAPTILDGAVSSGGYVNKAHDTTGQALTGSAEANSAVSIYLNGATTPAYTTTAGANGAWSKTVGSLADGTYSYSATATDAAGNTSLAAILATFTVDAHAPSSPTILDGAVSRGGYVNKAHDTTGQALTGSAEANSAVSIYLNGATTPAYTTTAGANGAWSKTVGSLADGTYSYSATATDAAGNTSLAGTLATFTVDTHAPSAPTILDGAVSSGGYVNKAHDTTGQALTGSAEANSAVSIYLNGATTPAYTTTAGANGAWSKTIGSLADGTYSYSATATDAAGNTSLAGTLATFTVDTHAPSKPSISDSAVSNKYVNKASDTTGQALTGSAEANSTVSIYLNGATTPAYTTTANASGAWSKTVGSLTDGTYSYSATATDAAGNTSLAATLATFTVDTTAPTVKQVVAIPGSGTLNAGQSGLIDLVTSENVKVSGAELLLSNGGVATYDASHSTGTSLVFDYSVDANTNQGTNKTAVSVVGVEYAAGGGIQDSAGNAAVLAGAAKSLGFAVAGTVPKPASVAIDNGGTAEIFGASSENVAFSSSTGSTGTLKLDKSTAFTGTVSNLTGNKTTGQYDVIDLADFAYNSGTVANWSKTGVNSSGQTTGVLTVSNAAHSATIALLGNYASSQFITGSDAHGGTTVVDPPKAVAATLIAGSTKHS